MDVIKLESGIVSRARELTDAGLSEFDALHLACASAGGADVFLTADDRFVQRANRQVNTLGVLVMNPVSFLQEVENALCEMTDQEFRRHALCIVQRELGMEGFGRFLRLYRAGRATIQRSGRNS